MRKALRNGGGLAMALLFAVSSFAQDRTLWRTSADVREGVRGSMVGTVTDVNEGARRFELQAEDDRYGRVTVITDSVSTQYNGFGGVINGKPEIFTGSTGFANVREGDRLEVRGTGTNNAGIYADTVTLLGRSVAAGQVGVGSTRPPGSATTPTGGASGTTVNTYARVEGIIRQMNLNENRLVVETDRRELINVRVTGSTPVYYRNDTYTVRNLEVGDRIRIEPDTTYSSSDRELRARSIDVTQSVQDRGTTGGDTRRFTTLTGRITRIDRNTETVTLDTGRESIRIDLRDAMDDNNRRVRAADLRVGDLIEVAGNYNGTVFMATTLRYTDSTTLPSSGGAPTTSGANMGDLVIVTLTGTVTESLDTSSTLVVRDRNSGRTVELSVTEDFLVRTKSGGTTTADKLKVNDSVVVKAFRDDLGRTIAQTIRMR